MALFCCSADLIPRIKLAILGELFIRRIKFDNILLKVWGKLFVGHIEMFIVQKITT